MTKSLILSLLLVLMIGASFRVSGENVPRLLFLDPFSDDLTAESTDEPGNRLKDEDYDFISSEFLKSYGHTIKRHAGQYGMDWRLVLAIIKQESRFSIDAVSHKGAFGLMQLMPHTGSEISRILRLQDIVNPENNIRGGIFYLKKLYDLFKDASEYDRVRLALAAYNGGLGRVWDAQRVAAYAQDDPRTWRAVRDALPLLSKRYYTLHKMVWDEEKPRAGWFGNSRETISYVERVMEYYDVFRDWFPHYQTSGS